MRNTDPIKSPRNTVQKTSSFAAL